ncbi:hypothetical protein QZH41_020476 [Actinostola sp. cb2023]|nr:hypothetical protein QZH41_020476 [Actinostola sp. cb2023]
MAATTSIKSPSSILAAIRMLTSSSTVGTLPNPTRNFEDILLGRIKEFQSSFESLSVKFDFENQEIHNFDCQNFFKEKIDVFSAKQDEGAGIQDHEKSTIRWMFIEICLFLVKELKKILQEISNEAKYLENTTESQQRQQNPKLNPDALSVNDQKTILSCIQFIVCLGIYPNLLPGVGIPVEKRSGYFELIKGSGNELQNERHLYRCLSALLDCIKHPSLGTLMLSRHLGDILTGLIQVCYAPQSSYYHGNGMGGNQMSESVDQKDDYKEDEEISDGSDKESKKELKNVQKNPENVNKCHEKMFILSSERENCAHELQRLLNRVYQPLIIKELLMIQSGMNRKSGRKDGRKQVQKNECMDASNGNVGTNSATPQWFVDVCGELLSARLIKPNGVQAVLRAVFETSGGSHSAQDWRKCDMVAMVIASCPSQANSTQEYYEHISPQVLQLLRVKNNELGKQFVRVTSSTVKAMLKHNSCLAKKYILDVMMSPLLRTTEYSECQPGSVVCCEEALTQSIEDIYKVFVVGSDPQSTFLLSLCAVIHPIFELFCFTRKGISHLRSSCQELLVRYLKHIDSSLALKTLYILAYRQLPPKNFGEATTEKPGSSQPPQEVCQRKDNQATKNTSLTISEKSTSEKTSISDSREPIRSHDACCHDNPMPVKLMRCEYSYCHGDSGGILIKSGATWVESFDDVMQRLTGDDVMMHEVRATCLVELLVGMKKDGLSGEFFLHLMKELTRIVSNGDETAVNDEPADLRVYDTQANTHQHSLVILQLVALMCDKLGPSILKDVHHMLAFVKSTLQRGCILCDSDSGLLEGSLVAETLTMAFGMLSAILGGAANVEAKERDSLEELLPLLEKLSLQHPNTEVKEMAHDLRIAIATHGAVWSQQMKEVAEGLGKKKQDNGSKGNSHPTLASLVLSSAPASSNYMFINSHHLQSDTNHEHYIVATFICFIFFIIIIVIIIWHDIASQFPSIIIIIITINITYLHLHQHQAL